MRVSAKAVGLSLSVPIGIHIGLIGIVAFGVAVFGRSCWIMTSSIGIVAYLALFALVGLGFVLINLFVGRFLRPADPHPEKLEIYECGEPTIGSSFVQFDLRFYVVALVFIVFDVEVAFMFPWATVYGKAVNLMRLVDSDTTDSDSPIATMSASQVQLVKSARGLHRELGVADPNLSTEGGFAELQRGSRNLVHLAAVSMCVFFFVLLLGFAYEWKTGAMDWVRAVTEPDTTNIVRGPPEDVLDEEPVLSV